MISDTSRAVIISAISRRQRDATTLREEKNRLAEHLIKTSESITRLDNEIAELESDLDDSAII